jgi:hypothetical protein
VLPVTPDEVRAYLASLELANEFELEELRQAPIELKLRQIWTLMTSADLFEDAEQRDIEAKTTRERWDRLYRALHV